jgi:hypothetical protein
MERARALTSATQPQLHWPRRRRVITPQQQPPIVPVEQKPTEGVSLWRVIAIAAFLFGIGGGLGEGLPALVRWWIPLS